MSMPANKSPHNRDRARSSVRRWRSLISFLVAMSFVFLGVRLAEAETLLVSMLHLAGGDVLVESETIHTTTTQNDTFLQSTTQTEGLRIITTVKRLAPCEFDVAYRGIPPVEGEYHLDLSHAQFDLVHVVQSRNTYGHKVQVLSIPGAKICMISGRDYLNSSIAAGECLDHYDVGAVYLPKEFEFVMAAIKNVRDACSAVSLNSGSHPTQLAMD